MIGNNNLLLEITDYQGTIITFGDDSKGKSMSNSKIIHGNIVINDVLLVENLYYNLISISQQCDSGYILEFYKHTCIVKNPMVKLC